MVKEADRNGRQFQTVQADRKTNFLQTLLTIMAKRIFKVIHNDGHETHYWGILLGMFYFV